MDSFVSRHASEVKGTLSGFDRVRFRGTLRWLANLSGMGTWLSHAGVLYKDFKEYALSLTERIKESTVQVAEKAGRPIEYLPSSSTRKEDVARGIAESDGIEKGLVCVLTAVEPCRTFAVGPNRSRKRLELRSEQRKCLHQYFYLIDPKWGWLNVRLQTWFPFTIHVVINGREWLSQELQRKQIAFERRDNCFVDISDMAGAQRIMNQQVRTNWTKMLNQLVRQVHPAHRTMFGKDQLDHYWSADETEWATDIMFDSPEALSAKYPHLVQYAMSHFDCKEILRFLGKRPHVKSFRTAEIVSHLGCRVEGLRVKHSVERNSVKMYDKQGSVLRVETTINNTRHMKSLRTLENDPHGVPSWQRLRKGVADLERRTEISQKANERYLDALSSVEATRTLAEATAAVCQRTRWQQRSVRALNPLAAEDAKLLKSVGRAEFVLLGFRNSDLRELLFEEPKSESQRKSLMAKTTRLIRLLRAHGIVHKVSKTNRYLVSKHGREIITALLAARDSKVHELLKKAA